MEAQFWPESWERGGTRTSVRRPDVHPSLPRHCPPDFLRGKRVLVPLCGEGDDTLYLREHAAEVVGVEPSAVAVGQLFAEAGLAHERHGDRYEAERLTILCRDILTLRPAAVGTFDLVYDRAALVALPLPMRLRYVAKIDELTHRGSAQLVNTLEYAPRLEAPPFSVSPADMAGYYGVRWSVAHRECPLLPEHRMVRKLNLAFLIEHGFMLTRVSQ
jgi:thiopurine S-methyltransferase